MFVIELSRFDAFGIERVDAARALRRGGADVVVAALDELALIRGGAAPEPR